MTKIKRFSTLVVILLSILLSSSLRAQDHIEVINIENPELQAYMADSTYYYDNDYSTSVVSRYVGTGKSVYSRGLDYPQGKEVTWTPSASFSEIAEVRITVSNHTDFSDPTTFVPPMKRQLTSYQIRNNFPNLTYYYKVEEFLTDGSVNEVARGMYRTVGQVRMIRVNGAHNVRDLGGWPTQFGVPIKYGILYRSGNLDKVTAEGIHDFVDNLNVCAELDLRGGLRGEPSISSSPLGYDVDFIRISNDSYVGALQSQGGIYVRDLEWIIDRMREGKSVDWHCAVGCDRCGTVSFLIGGLLGMSEVDLCRDYELSSFRGYKRYRSHAGFRKMLPYIKKLGPEDDLAQCFYNYWTKNGMSEEDLDYFRTVMLGKGYNLPKRYEAKQPNDYTHIAKYSDQFEKNRAANTVHDESPVVRQDTKVEKDWAKNVRNESTRKRPGRQADKPKTDNGGNESAANRQDGQDECAVASPVRTSTVSDVPERPKAPATPAKPVVPERPKAPANTAMPTVPEKPKATVKQAEPTTPEKTKTPSKSSKSTKSSESKKSEKTKSKSEPKSKSTVVVVQKGESLYEIANKNGCTVEDLKKANGIKDANKIGIGDKIKLPGKNGKSASGNKSKKK